MAKQCNEGPVDTVISRDNVERLSLQKTVHAQTG
jgi:hypothetical protein